MARGGFCLAVGLMVVSGISGTPAATDDIEFDSGRWRVEAKEHRVEEYLGRPSLFLSDGAAWLEDDRGFLDGEITFDIAFTGERGFMGAMWRMQDPGNYEHFYVRPHQSGKPDANQYTPVFDGVSAWQLYHGEGYGAPVEYPVNTWIHVRILVSGNRAEVYIDSDEPVLAIDQLKREPRSGAVGLTASFAPAHFSGFRYRKLESPALRAAPRSAPAPPDRAVRQWRVSSPFDISKILEVTRLTSTEKEGLAWSSLGVEGSGITNLARLAGVAKGKNTVFATVVIESDREQVKAVRFGYSDDARVYLNDRLIYSGTNVYQSRDYRYLGTIGLFDAVHLPLVKGRNEIWFAVSERFGGWGIMAVLEDVEGVRFAEN